MKDFECANGRVYKFPENHCAFCEHCRDIIYDYTNGPYCFLCHFGGDFKTCGKFKEEIEEN